MYYGLNLLKCQKTLCFSRGKEREALLYMCSKRNLTNWRSACFGGSMNPSMGNFLSIIILASCLPDGFAGTINSDVEFNSSGQASGLSENLSNSDEHTRLRMEIDRRDQAISNLKKVIEKNPFLAPIIQGQIVKHEKERMVLLKRKKGNQPLNPPFLNQPSHREGVVRGDPLRVGKRTAFPYAWRKILTVCLIGIHFRV